MSALGAQQPAAPAVETRSADWTAAEARALRWLRSLQQQAATKPQQLPQDGVVLDQRYRIRGFVADADGAVVPSQRLGAGTPFFALAWPDTADDKARRAMLLHSDGTCLVAELSPGATAELLPELALAKGSAGRFADVLRQPGSGMNGEFWFWLDQCAIDTRIVVVDEHGGPLPGLSIVTGPQHHEPRLGLPLPHPVAIGDAITDDQGKARVRGPRCAVAVVTLNRDDSFARRDRIRIETDQKSMRLVVGADAFVPKQLFANEAAAIATLRNICSAQAQCQASGVIDQNGNGAGEYGGFGELSGEVVLRSRKIDDPSPKMNPPVLSAVFRQLEQLRTARSGYLFQMWLPGKDGVPVPADAEDAATRIDPTLAESLFTVVAWPVVHGKSGLRAFAVTQQGLVLCCEQDGRYSGHERPLLPLAPLVPDGKGMHGALAVDAAGDDGQQWSPVR